MNQFSRSRPAWALLTLSSTGLLLTALYYQYLEGYAPCVMCVYQRAALCGIIVAGLLGWLAPAHRVVSHVALAGWLFASVEGFLLAKEHVGYQLNPSPFHQCSTVAEFPVWFQLEAWWPALFFPSGDCASIDWHWLGLSMPQWLMGIFGGMAALAAFFIGVRVAAMVRREG
ncbi:MULTISPECIES: disulfide bond formation protein DsbB [Oceanimonas]|uniref:Disulfide bond formation protein B n=1 Tax=Oceanimonas doudoroffii TaxID=84158 RepID=A0A233RGM0_9GAMM|nr:disulfide bond formation protein DsbB [Oceanimonas doudoroffii]NHI00851.1 Disulfide bond formation protein B [Oceanimonas sp. MB9]OXY82542.1 disulfide bond formation protein B [Oceanimonas doudoroffii]